jgi:hypothetical protein
MVNMYYNGTGSECTRTDYKTDTSYYSGYQITYYNAPPLPLKELKIIWAKMRMNILVHNKPLDQNIPLKIDYERPVALRGVKINGHGWAE